MTLPLPSYVAKMMQGLQVSSRQKTDARVQQVTESDFFSFFFSKGFQRYTAMNVIRMIKWFAWERKIKEDITAKREEELRYIRNVRLLVVLNNAVKYVISAF
jgi:hypothetical protein